MILEHPSSKEGVDFVRAHAPQVGGTVTPCHMELTRGEFAQPTGRISLCD
jgi:dihydroorotase